MPRSPGCSTTTRSTRPNLWSSVQNTRVSTKRSRRSQTGDSFFAHDSVHRLVLLLADENIFGEIDPVPVVTRTALDRVGGVVIDDRGTGQDVRSVLPATGAQVRDAVFE